MKNIGLILSCIILLSSVNCLAKEKLLIVGDYWCPYNCNPNDQNPGFLIEVASHAFDIFGYEVEYKMMPWHEALNAIEDGTADAIVGIGNVRGRNVITTKNPQEYSQTKCYTRKDSYWGYDGPSSLNNMRIGFVMDYSIDEDINNYFAINYPFKSDQFVVEDGDDAVTDCIANLVDGSIDVYVEDARVVEYFTRQNNLEPYLRQAGNTGENKMPVYIAIRKNHPSATKLVDLLEQGIASIKSTGQYGYLQNKYGM